MICILLDPPVLVYPFDVETHNVIAPVSIVFTIDEFQIYYICAIYWQFTLWPHILRYSTNMHIIFGSYICSIAMLLSI